MADRAHYSHIAQMEPLMPAQDADLNELVLNVARSAGELKGKFHPITQQSVAALLRNMNSYYSNLIEGNRTHPRDIEKALRNRFSRNAKQKALQLESRAHVEVQALMETRLRDEKDLNICGTEFLKWLHKEFYERLPREFRETHAEGAKSVVITPGELRTSDVEVGQHIPPRWEAVPEFMARFASFYDPRKFSGTERIVAWTASHQRLLWIHPFLDGNGRVSRLFSHAYSIACDLDAHGMWTVARGLSRTRERYFGALDSADIPRQGALDGRGNLSERGLRDFCIYFLTTTLDQIQFMSGLLNFENMENTIRFYAAEKGFSPEMARLLLTLLHQGEIARGEAGRLLGRKEVRSRQLLKKLLEAGILTSSTPKGAVRLAFPTDAAEIIFPRLFPAE